MLLDVPQRTNWLKDPPTGTPATPPGQETGKRPMF